MPEGIIRPYESTDRQAVRHICYETGYMGDSPSFYWGDRESFSDMWSGYYTDKEPESLFVADLNGQVAGYLLGCLDSKKASNPVGIGIRYAFLKGGLLNSTTRPTLLRTVVDALSDSVRGASPLTGPFHDSRWPSHLHINFLPEARGKGLGRKIVEAWLDKLRSLGSPGCHLETLAENTSAIAFFKSVGFEIHGDPQVAPGLRSKEGERLHGQVLVQSL
ncbi:MAG: GNAT family N-acetyltransferase [Acidimicrobiales bacterium]|nr:GNAT family N-acetyltransferase [Acidimicrobiales bacterium]